MLMHQFHGLNHGHNKAEKSGGEKTVIRNECELKNWENTKKKKIKKE